LANPIAATIADAQGICTIINNDPAPRLFISDATVTEEDAQSANALFQVSLRPASGTTVTVHFSSTNGSAGALDYVATNGALTFAPGETNQIIAVPVLADTLSESNETFSIRLSAPTNALLGDAIGVGTILDNDPVAAISIHDTEVVQASTATTNATFRVLLSAVSGRTVTVRYATSNGTAQAGADFVSRSGTLTFLPGTTTQDVTVVVNRASANESTEFFFVNLTGAINATLADPQAVGGIFSQPPIARTPPMGVISNPRFLDVRRVNGATRLRFQTRSDFTYRVEYRDELSADASWQSLPGATSVPGTGGVIEVLDDRTAEPHRFYRLQLE
jgi:serralysin